MTVLVRRRAPGSPALSAARVRRDAEVMLAALGLTGVELGVLLCDDARIRELNRAHRDQDRPTDVLSFPLFEGRRALADARRALASAAPTLLGDVVVSLDTAARQAAGRRRPLEAEVRFLLAHGVLHLVGHDHAQPDEKRIMVLATRSLVRAAERGGPATGAAQKTVARRGNR